jgi:xanthine dehydrogenase accessory factor
MGENVMLLVVAESYGSSPGRAGYKMAVGTEGKLCGSIGGGVMEVNLVEQGLAILTGAQSDDERRTPHVSKGDKPNAGLTEQVHRKGVPNSSGMICSGKQTVIFKILTPDETETLGLIINALQSRRPDVLTITHTQVSVEPCDGKAQDDLTFQKVTDTDFTYREKLGFKNDLYIIGGGHCALALSELMSKMDFHISIFDDRPELNTIEKNRFAHEITIIGSYDQLGAAIPSGTNAYVVVMTLGYKSDETVIRALVDKNFKYFGVLGSKAKMATLMKELRADGVADAKLKLIHTPVGLPINSRTPEEIAVSIAAEIIAVKNAA